MTAIGVAAPPPPGPPEAPVRPEGRRFPDLGPPGRVHRRRPEVAPTVMAALFLGSVFVSRFALPGLLAAVVGVAVFALRAVTRGRIDRMGLWALACLAFTAASGFAVGAAPGRADLATFMGQDGRIFIAYVPFLVFATMTTTRVHVDRLRTLLRILILFTPVAWAVTTAGILPAYRRHGAFIGLASSHHAMGMLMGVVGLTLLIAPGRRRGLDRAFGIAAVAMVAVVGSRTSMTGLLFAAVYLFFRTPSVVHRLRTVVVVIVALIVVLAASGRTASTVRFITSPEFIDAAATELSTPEVVEEGTARVDSGPTSGAEISNVLLRFGLWRTAADEWVRSPVVGIGAWRFNDPYRSYAGVPGLQVATGGRNVHDGFGAHNLVLQTLAETGIIGLGLLLSPWLALIRRVRRGRLPDADHKVVIALLFFGVGTTMTSNSLISPALTFPLLAIALTFARQRGADRQVAPSPSSAALAPVARGWWLDALDRRAATTAARRGLVTAPDVPAGRIRVDGPPPPAPGTGPPPRSEPVIDLRTPEGVSAPIAARARRGIPPWEHDVGAWDDEVEEPAPVVLPLGTDVGVDAAAVDAVPEGGGGRGRRARRTLGVLLLRVGAAGVQLVAVVAVGRALGADVLGQYLVFQAVVRVGATALAWGHPWTVLRAVAVHDASGDRDGSRAVFRAGLRSQVVGSAALAVAVAVVALGAATWTGSPVDVDPWVVVTCGLALSGLAFSLVAANGLKARDLQGTGLVIEFAPQPLGACAVAAAVLVTGRDVDMAVLGAAMAVAGVLAAAFGIWLWFHDDRRRATGPVVDLVQDDGRDERGRAAFGLTNLANVLGNNALPLLLPLVMSLDDVGRLGAVLRLTAIPGTIGSGLVSVYAPRFATEWAAGARRRLAASLRETQIWMLVLYAPFGIAFILLPGLLVTLLGSDFADTESALRIVGLGQAVSAFAGTGVVFLSMCRQERFALAATVASVVVGTAVALVGGVWWGVTGASVGYAVVLGVANGSTLVWAHLRVLRRMPARDPVTAA